MPGTDVVVLFFQKADLLLVLLDVQRIGGTGCLFIIEEAETEEGWLGGWVLRRDMELLPLQEDEGVDITGGKPGEHRSMDGSADNPNPLQANHNTPWKQTN